MNLQKIIATPVRLQATYLPTVTGIALFFPPFFPGNGKNGNTTEQIKIKTVEPLLDFDKRQFLEQVKPDFPEEIQSRKSPQFRILLSCKILTYHGRVGHFPALQMRCIVRMIPVTQKQFLDIMEFRFSDQSAKQRIIFRW